MSVLTDTKLLALLVSSPVLSGCINITGSPDEAEEVHGTVADVLLQARGRFPDPLREEIPRRNPQEQGGLQY